MSSWFITKNGRLFTRISVGVISVSIIGARFMFHGPLLHKHQEIFQIHCDGEPKPMPEQLVLRTQEVLKDCGLDEKASKVTFFPVVGHDVYHGGYRKFPWGAIVGLPFNYEKQQYPDLSRLRLGSITDIDWAIEGSDFLETLDLSIEAQKFGIAKEIFAAGSSESLENMLITGICLLFPAELSRKVNKFYKMFRRTFQQRFLCYLLFYSLGYVFYSMLKDPMKHLYDQKNDEKAAKLGPDYIKGGIEYYEKMLLGNQELRVLMGPRGKSLFTEQGNLNYLIQSPKLPLTKHLENLKKLEKEQMKEV